MHRQVGVVRVVGNDLWLCCRLEEVAGVMLSNRARKQREGFQNTTHEYELRVYHLTPFP